MACTNRVNVCSGCSLSSRCIVGACPPDKVIGGAEVLRSQEKRPWRCRLEPKRTLLPVDTCFKLLLQGAASVSVLSSTKLACFHVQP